MIHILLFILKIVGIILLFVVGLAFLLSVIPVTYRIKINIRDNKVVYHIHIGGLFYILYFIVNGYNKNYKVTVRIFGFPIKKSQRLPHKQRNRSIFKNTGETRISYRHLFKNRKQFVKLVRYLKPRKIIADIVFGLERPDATGKIFGLFTMIFSIWNIRQDKIRIVPDFAKRIIKGKVLMKGHILPGVVLLYCFQLYFNKEKS